MIKFVEIYGVYGEILKKYIYKWKFQKNIVKNILTKFWIKNLPVWKEVNKYIYIYKKLGRSFEEILDKSRVKFE